MNKEETHMKKFLSLLLALTMLLTSACALADAAWPDGTVQLIVAAKAGGGTDLIARIIAEKMSEIAGKPVVVVNQTEGNGAIAFDTVMNDDDAALNVGFFIPSFMTAYITGSTDMDPLKDYQVASFLDCTDSNYFVVRNDSPFNTMEEVIAYAKENPGKLSLGLSLGSRTHFTVAEFAQAASIEFKYVEAGKAADQTTALLGGHIDITLLNVANTQQYVLSGDMKALATTATPYEADEKLMAVPTLADLGYEGLKCKADFFFMTSNEASAETLEAINAIVTETMADATVSENIVKLGYLLTPNDIATSAEKFAVCYNTFDSNRFDF